MLFIAVDPVFQLKSIKRLALRCAHFDELFIEGCTATHSFGRSLQYTFSIFDGELWKLSGDVNLIPSISFDPASLIWTCDITDLFSVSTMAMTPHF